MNGLRRGLIVSLLLIAANWSLSAKGDVTADDWAKMRPIVPRGYVCYRTTSPIDVDVKAGEEAWKSAAWTEDFVDIEGDAKPRPRFRTRAKMLWDDQYLYVYAELEEPQVWGTLTQKNSIIFYDNDFEVFINPDANNHNYYEFEMNALNSIWELTLDKPYRDGGPAHLGTNLEGLKSAVRVDGTLNDPSDKDRGWSVEIAFPWKGLSRYATPPAVAPPKDGQQWRVGFSRVEWEVDVVNGKYQKVPREKRPEENWVWSPQGVVDMHRPERWGYVQFSTAAPGTVKFVPDPTLAARDALMEIYYAQREFFRVKRKYAGTLKELNLAEPRRNVEIVGITPRNGGYLATAKVTLEDGSSKTLTVREDSKLGQVAGTP